MMPPVSYTITGSKELPEKLHSLLSFGKPIVNENMIFRSRLIHQTWQTPKPLHYQRAPCSSFRILRRNPLHPHHLHFLVRKPRSCSLHLSSFLTPPAAFLGLLVTLWAYKSLMLVIFQNKIIYMPSVPPFSRAEKIEDYAVSCRPVVWREERIRAADGTRLTLAVGEIPARVKKSGHEIENESKRRKRVVILYFQGYVSASFSISCLPHRFRKLAKPQRR